MCLQGNRIWRAPPMIKSPSEKSLQVRPYTVQRPPWVKWRPPSPWPPFSIFLIHCCNSKQVITRYPYTHLQRFYRHLPEVCTEEG